jgi:hypothetical protein
VRLVTVVSLAALAACASDRGPAIVAGTSSAAAPNYELDCEAANTASNAQLHCVRTDTRTGDIVVVEPMRLPVSTGPTGAGQAPAGRFTTVCEATSTTDRADLYCVRMNTETGELLLVNLQKVGVVPPPS